MANAAPSIPTIPISDAISDVKIHLLTPNGNSKVMALASVTIDLGEEFQLALHGIRIVDGTKGLFLGFPQREGTDGKWYDHYHPISGRTRELITAVVLEEYEKLRAPKPAPSSGSNRRGGSSGGRR